MNNEREFDLLPLLDHIDPSILSYQEWVNVGMALKHEGYTASDWDNWSQNDTRYRKFECFKKWDTFNEEAGSIVTGGTIVQLAKDHGWVNPYSSDSEGAHELDCSVIYCHHHSKGSQGNKKSMDRASGSGVFARDPDALIDLVELDVTEELFTQRINHTATRIYKEALQTCNLGYYQEEVSLDDLQSPALMRTHFEQAIPNVLDRKPWTDKIEEARRAIEISTAWRVEGTLREFAKFKPINMWFSYPVHFLDDSGVLADIQLEDTNGNNSPWKKNFDKKETKEDKSEKVESAIYSIYDGINPVTIDDLIEYFSTDSKQVSEKTVRRWIKNNGNFTIKNKEISPKNDEGQK